MADGRAAASCRGVRDKKRIWRNCRCDRRRLDQGFRERDAFKILHTGVRRPKTSSGVSGADSEILVFVRREVATFSWTVEVNPGSRAHWDLPLATELCDLMIKALANTALD